MNRGDGKYQACDGQIVKIVTGEPIPEDEPIFILRARDRVALGGIHEYLQACIDDGCTEYHIEGILSAYSAFAKFQLEHPDRMKQPGITRGL